MITWLVGLAIFLLFLFLPRLGLLALFQEQKKSKQRELIEDALKHLIDGEQGGDHITLESLAKALNIKHQEALRLIQSMESQGLVETRAEHIHLTAEGERWALHVVRAHRLWERYLADEARMPLENIHREAHRREHKITSDELDALEAALGYPTHDPHGDPIPTLQGAPPSVPSTPLTEWEIDSPANIVHLEDEPIIAYQQILASGLQLGQTIRILEKNSQRFVLSDGENEYRLAPSIASNVFVAPLPEEKRRLRDAIPLEMLPTGQQAHIVALDERVQGFTRRRLLDLGLTPGTKIYPELGNFFGDPRAYRVRGTLIALRKDQAAQVWVKPEASEQAQISFNRALPDKTRIHRKARRQ